MKKNRYIVWLIIISGIFMGSVKAQDTSSTADYTRNDLYKVQIMVRSYGDSIVLRWAPENPAVWLLGNSYGWNVQRNTEEGVSYPGLDSTDIFYNLNSKPLRPLSLEEMKARYDSTDTYIGAAAQALYGQAPVEVDANSGDFFNYAFRKNQEQELRQFTAYLAAEGHPHVADALGLRFVDKNVRQGELYQYNIVSLIPEKYAQVDEKSIIIQCKPFIREADEMVPEVNIMQKDAYSAVVYWGRNKLSGYYVERSTDKGKTWKKMNEGPIYGMDPDESSYALFGNEIGDLMKHNAIMFDSLDLNTKYIYRVKGFDVFGDEAPYSQSQPFEMLDIIPPSIPYLVSALPTDNKICTLQWYKDTLEEDFKGYMITFADNPDGPWGKVTTDILPPKTTQYTDKQAGERGRGYYRIFAVDKSGNFSYSLSLINNIEDVKAPAPPTGFFAVVDTNGIVNFMWNKSPEKDVNGYRIYFANQLDHDFIELSPGTMDTLAYQDTIDLHTLTPFIYYYLIAEDFSHNLSKPSDTIALPVPDIVPPGAALLIDYTETEESVVISWLKSTSEDVAYYYFYRKPKNQKQWQLVQACRPENAVHSDTVMLVDYPEPSDIPYQYCVEVIDDARLTSGKNGMVTIRFNGPAVIQIPIELKASLDKKNNAVQLTWKYEYDSDRDHYGVVYRSVDGAADEAVYNFKRGETQYLDRDIKAGSKAEYYIRLFLGKGKRSAPSKKVILVR